MFQTDLNFSLVEWVYDVWTIILKIINMKYIFKCLYLKSDNHPDIWPSCMFVNEQNNTNDIPKIYEYLAISIGSDIYLPHVIQQHFTIIEQVENSPEQVLGGGGMQFSLDFHHDKVVFYHNEFDEEDGWPSLSCPLSAFKATLIAWHAFLQLPKSVYSKLETAVNIE